MCVCVCVCVCGVKVSLPDTCGSVRARGCSVLCTSAFAHATIALTPIYCEALSTLTETCLAAAAMMLHACFIYIYLYALILHLYCVDFARILRCFIVMHAYECMHTLVGSCNGVTYHSSNRYHLALCYVAEVSCLCAFSKSQD